MVKLGAILGLALLACSGGQTSTETKPGKPTNDTPKPKPKPKPISALVGLCTAHELPKTAWTPSRAQLRTLLQQSEEDMRRFYEGGSVSIPEGKLLEAAEQCVKARNSTSFDMEVCGDRTGDEGRGCYQLNIYALDWKGRHWVSVYYNYGNDSMIDIYEIRDNKVESYCPAFTPQFHKLCSDMENTSSDASCAKLETDWKDLPEAVRMALCFPGQN